MDITEAEARDLATTALSADEKIEPEDKKYTFENGWTACREQGLIYLPKNGGIGIPGNNRWVLRNADGNAVDVDRYRTDLFERHRKETDCYH